MWSFAAAFPGESQSRPKKPAAKYRAVSMTRLQSLAQKLMRRWDAEGDERRGR